MYLESKKCRHKRVYIKLFNNISYMCKKCERPNSLVLMKSPPFTVNVYIDKRLRLVLKCI